MLKRLSMYAALLFLVPLIVLVSGWHWHETQDYGMISHLLYWVTETASKPYFIITSILFAAFYFFAIKDKKTAIKVIVIMAFSLVVALGMKIEAKKAVKETRPFMTQVLKGVPNPQTFYSLKKSVRAVEVKEYYKQYAQNVPEWLVNHRSHETSFSFPSGHSTFVTTWVLLAVGFSLLLGNSKALRYFANFLTVWAILVLISRIQLGMHFPWDEMGAIVMSWIWMLIVFFFLQKKKWMTEE